MNPLGVARTVGVSAASRWLAWRYGSTYPGPHIELDGLELYSRGPLIDVARDVLTRYLHPSLKGGDRERYYTLRRGETGVEVGAYTGLFAVKMAQRVGVEGRVVAVEPSKRSFEVLKLNRDVNRLPWLHVENQAVASRSGLKELRCGGEPQAIGDRSVIGTCLKMVVPAVSLDVLLAPLEDRGVDFLSLEMNGGEYAAIRGMEDYYPRRIYAACRYLGDPRREAMLAELRVRGYDVSYHREGVIYAESYSEHDEHDE